MTVHRIENLGITITQTALWLEINLDFLVAGLRSDSPPVWLEYCLDIMETEFENDPEIFTWYNIGAQFNEDTWSSRTARAAIPVLIESASLRKLITYKELDEKLRQRDPERANAGSLQKYAKPLGMIGHVIDELRNEAIDELSLIPKSNSNHPPLEAIVVRGREQVPGGGIDGFLVSYLNDKYSGKGGQFSKDSLKMNREEFIAEIHSDVFDWGNWSALEKLAESNNNK